ncbi:MarR family winged helix-turn-helix transcriptional regulator [Clostridium sp. UBA4548]|uniref:MarR family winged helix-turn-helix transcriptional regulator n=1 Tax=Clostridium sp. UBA4548 TaxID=1946361 RepID=UPI0025B8A736|nr:MarR family winged helix-turn-helix transcriptional regulator [Clostridium sp. UBA4548]
MSEENRSLIKFVNTISRITQSYTDEVMVKLNLTSGTYPFLLVLYRKEGINQNEISRELNVDKAMSARSIKKLIDLEYIEKKEDEKDSRAYKLYLTEKGRAIVPEIKKEIQQWIKIITKDFSKDEEALLEELLSKVLSNAKKHKEKIEKGD